MTLGRVSVAWCGLVCFGVALERYRGWCSDGVAGINGLRWMGHWGGVVWCWCGLLNRVGDSRKGCKHWCWSGMAGIIS